MRHINTIVVGSRKLPAALCPTCKGKIYPPKDVALCIRRHAEIAAAHGYKVCFQCKQARPVSCYNRAKRRCDDCTSKKPKPPQPKPGQGIEFVDYLADFTYAWGE